MRKIGILESRIYSNSYSDTSWVLLCNGSETQDGEGGLLLVASPKEFSYLSATSLTKEPPARDFYGGS